MLHQTKGIVLSQIKYGESSLIVNIYTEKFGRQSYMVKGSRSRKSRSKSNLFRPFFLLDMEVYHKEGKNMQTLKEVRLTETLNNIIFDVYKSTMVLFLAEISSKVLKEEEANQELFVFLYNSIRFLDLTEDSIKYFHLYYLSKLTRYLGFFPQLNKTEGTPLFDMDNGRFVSLGNRHAHCLNQSESNSIYSLFNTSIENLNELSISKKELKSVLRGMLNFYALQTQGFSTLKSLIVLEEVFHNGNDD